MARPAARAASLVGGDGQGGTSRWCRLVVEETGAVCLSIGDTNAGFVPKRDLICPSRTLVDRRLVVAREVAPSELMLLVVL